MAIDVINITASMSTNVIDVQDLASEIKIYPNPTNGEFTIDIPQQLVDQNVNVKIVDILGRSTLNMDNEKNIKKLALNIPGLVNGVFFVKVSGDN